MDPRVDRNMGTLCFPPNIKYFLLPTAEAK